MRHVIISANGAGFEVRSAFFDKVDKLQLIGSATPDLSRFEYYPEEHELEKLLAVIPPSFSFSVHPPL